MKRMNSKVNGADRRRTAELLAPAGSYESMIAAVNAGADAVYVGGRMFGARAYADNPDKERLLRGLDYCHIHGRKLYLTVNTLLKERELTDMLYPYLLPYWENGVDGLIVQDLGVMRFVQEHFPGLPIHASTQMTVTGPEGARLLKAQGVSRVVPARELSLEEIRAIIEEAGVEVETFVHGAMCYSYSGQCLFSSLLGGRSGNRGRCAQPCRLPYTENILIYIKDPERKTTVWRMRIAASCSICTTAAGFPKDITIPATGGKCCRCIGRITGEGPLSGSAPGRAKTRDLRRSSRLEKVM